MNTSGDAARLRPGRIAWAGLAVLLLTAATLNSGGYHYGIGDQAFYVPAVLEHMEPALFPRDDDLIEAEDRLILFTEVIAWFSRTTRVPLPVCFLALHVATLLLLFGAIIRFGLSFYASAWTAAALAAAMTLRHRITQTAANTLEGYFHPRLLAFALGVSALVAILREKPLPAIALVGVAMLVHPTTALFFGVVVAVSIFVLRPAWRRQLLALGAILFAAFIRMAWQGPLAGRFVMIDDTWQAVLRVKDYLYPTEWGLSAWIVNLSYPVLIVAIFVWRRRSNVALPAERGLVAGALALLGLFLVSLPFVTARVALAVQLQVSRVFWLLDFVATVCVVWALSEAPWWRSPARRVRPAAVLFALVTTASLCRGAWVTFVEHPNRPPFSVDVPESAWDDAMDWLRRTPADAHVLAHPGHAWLYGTSVRVAAARDVFLEEVKDSAIGMYSREAAMRVLERIRVVGGFNEMTPERALELARAYDIDYLVTERSLALPLAYQNSTFRIYRLQ